MKKQILFLAFFVAAIIAGTSSAYAQVDDAELDAAVAACPVPAVLNCGTAGALSPSPGEIYQYDIAVTGAGTKVHWFVTTDVDVIAAAALTSSIEPASGGVYVLSAGTTTIAGSNATYNDAANVGDVLEVAWNYFNPSTTVLLVAFAIDAAGCTNNVEVYKIEPVFNFVLEIAALEDDGTIQVPATPKECASPVQSAQYDAANDELDMDYGDNYIYYIVSAANWVHSWDPAFVTPTSAGGSTIGTVEWTYAADADDPAATWHTDADPVLASAYGAGVTSIGASGACIVLRVNVDHGNANEMIAAETLTTGVNGVMYSSTLGDYTDGNLADLDDNGAGGCANNITDQAGYIISPRPDINAQNPTPFVTKN